MFWKCDLSLSWRSAWGVSHCHVFCKCRHPFQSLTDMCLPIDVKHYKSIMINIKNSRYVATSTCKHCQKMLPKKTACHNTGICYTCTAGIIWEFKKWWLGKQPTVIQITWWDLNCSEHIQSALLSVQTLPSSEICHHIIWYMGTSISEEHMASTCGTFFLLFLSLPTTLWTSCCYRHSPTWL